MKTVLLASKSPRRLELLQMLGYEVQVAVSDVDEDAVSASSPAALTETLSRLKAEAVATAFPDNTLPIIAADTLVALDGDILGKPRTPEEAATMLRRLSGKAHDVHTGFTVIQSGAVTTGVESARVYFRELTEEEIEAYVASGAPMDKAGAYGIQGPAGAFVKRIEGDYFSIVGLPLCRISEILH